MDMVGDRSHERTKAIHSRGHGWPVLAHRALPAPRRQPRRPATRDRALTSPKDLRASEIARIVSGSHPHTTDPHVVEERHRSCGQRRRWGADKIRARLLTLHPRLERSSSARILHKTSSVRDSKKPRRSRRRASRQAHSSRIRTQRHLVG